MSFCEYSSVFLSLVLFQFWSYFSIFPFPHYFLLFVLNWHGFCLKLLICVIFFPLSVLILFKKALSFLLKLLFSLSNLATLLILLKNLITFTWILESLDRQRNEDVRQVLNIYSINETIKVRTKWRQQTNIMTDNRLIKQIFSYKPKRRRISVI